MRTMTILLLCFLASVVSYKLAVDRTMNYAEALHTVSLKTQENIYLSTKHYPRKRFQKLRARGQFYDFSKNGSRQNPIFKREKR